jgi:hypothetical protein
MERPSFSKISFQKVKVMEPQSLKEKCSPLHSKTGELGSGPICGGWPHFERASYAGQRGRKITSREDGVMCVERTECTLVIRRTVAGNIVQDLFTGRTE